MFTQLLGPPQSIMANFGGMLRAMDSRDNPTKALIWDPRYDQFELIDPSIVAVTCVGREGCGNKIDEQNIAIAKSTTHDLLHPEFTEPPAAASQMRTLLSRLAKATLCQQEHQDRAAALSHRWYSNYEWCEPLDRPRESGIAGAYWGQDTGHDLRHDWKEVADRQPFRWEVNSEPPNNHHLASVVVRAFRLRERARREDLETAEREREERDREAERERQEQAREAHQAREARHDALMTRMLADQSAQAGEDRRPMQQSEAENEMLRKARQLQQEGEHRRATQTRAEALGAGHESRVEQEEEASAADEEARRREAQGGD